MDNLNENERREAPTDSKVNTVFLGEKNFKGLIQKRKHLPYSARSISARLQEQCWKVCSRNQLQVRAFPVKAEDTFRSNGGIDCM